MKRRALLQAAPGAVVWPAAAAEAREPGTLRIAFNSAEAGFDPPRVSDQSSLRVLSHIYESPLTFDPLADPAVVVPQTCAALPEVSDGHRRFVFTLRPGILFADHPAFGGRPRELTAADYVYSVKRYVDPAIASEHLYQFENAQILGLIELRRRAIQAKTPFPYDAPVEGLRVLDRYRFEVRLAEPAPRFLYLWTTPVFAGAVAREVVEAHGGSVMEHPVGTGPFRLAQWRRGSRIVLERNPRWRGERFTGQPAPGDAHAQAIAQRLAGRELPLLKRIAIDIIEEGQPRWLAFAGGEHDVLFTPPDYGNLAVPGGRLAPFLAQRGVQLRQWAQAATQFSYFNIDDPLVGGLAPERVALRRALGIAFDSAAELRLVYQGQGVPAQQMTPPACYGHDPALRTELGSADLARANALLDTWGWADRDGDGWREDPEGRPAVLRFCFTPNLRSRRSAELWDRTLKALRLKMAVDIAPFADLIQRALAGRFMIWGYAWSAPNPDGDFWLQQAYGPNAGQANDARLRVPAIDRLVERQRVMADGPERLALMQQAARLWTVHASHIPHHHVVANDLSQPHVAVFRRHPFITDWGRYAEVL